MPAAFTYKLSVQVLDFESLGLLIQLARLVCDSCSSGQRFAHSFLQIPPRDGHPCRSANGSPCRVHRRLSLPSECALPGAPKNALRTSPQRVFVLLLPTPCSLLPLLVTVYHSSLNRPQSRPGWIRRR